MCTDGETLPGNGVQREMAALAGQFIALQAVNALKEELSRYDT